jgi:hypothetical protein
LEDFEILPPVSKKELAGLWHEAVVDFGRAEIGRTIRVARDVIQKSGSGFDGFETEAEIDLGCEVEVGGGKRLAGEVWWTCPALVERH